MSLYTLFENHGVFVLGHRGFSEKFPENTMPSFAACVDVPGIDGVELDVHECKSGEIVVAHDGNLKRICNIDAFIEDKPWSYLKEVDVGSFKGSEFAGVHMPLLEDLFSEFGNKIVYDIELKVEQGRPYKNLCKKVWKLICDYDLQENVMVSSFNPLALRFFNRLCWMSVPTADIFSEDQIGPKVLHHGWGRHISNSSYSKPEFVQIGKFDSLWKDRDLIAWTVNTSADAVKLLQCPNVKGLIGNNPDILASAVNNRK